MSPSALPRRARFPLIAFWLVTLIAFTACTLPMSPQDSEEDISGPPTVRLASPVPNASYLEGVAVNIQASISNAGADISRVDIAVDDTVIASLESPNPANAEVFNITETWPAQGLGAHTITVTAYRSDGTSSAPASVTINVVEEPGDTSGSEEQQPSQPTPDTQTQPTQPQEPTQPSEPTDPPPPTEPPATPTPSVPMARFNTGINVRSGPGTNFEPPIGAFAANQTAEILAVNPAGSWLKVRYFNADGWVYAPLVTVEGDISNLPRDPGPPTPVPTATPVPVTPTPATTNNLVVTQPFIDPPNPVCGQDFTVGMTIRNDGSGSLSTGLSQIRDVHIGSGTVTATSGGALVPVTLEPGGTHRVTYTFNIDVFFGERHRIEFVADANNDVAETIEDDNQINVEYTLGACP